MRLCHVSGASCCHGSGKGPESAVVRGPKEIWQCEKRGGAGEAVRETHSQLTEMGDEVAAPEGLHCERRCSGA